MHKQITTKLAEYYVTFPYTITYVTNKHKRFLFEFFFLIIEINKFDKLESKKKSLSLNTRIIITSCTYQHKYYTIVVRS